MQEALKGAESDFKQANLAVIRRAATESSQKTRRQQITMPDGSSRTEVLIETIPPTWQPAAWLLERRFPQEFAVQRKLEHSGKIDNPSAGGRFEVVIVDPDEEKEGRMSCSPGPWKKDGTQIIDANERFCC